MNYILFECDRIEKRLEYIEDRLESLQARLLADPESINEIGAEVESLEIEMVEHFNSLLDL